MFDRCYIYEHTNRCEVCNEVQVMCGMSERMVVCLLSCCNSPLMQVYASLVKGFTILCSIDVIVVVNYYFSISLCVFMLRLPNN